MYLKIRTTYLSAALEATFIAMGYLLDEKQPLPRAVPITSEQQQQPKERPQ